MTVDKEHLASVLHFEGHEAGFNFAWGRKLDEDDWLESFTVTDCGEIKVPVSLEVRPQYFLSFNQ